MAADPTRQPQVAVLHTDTVIVATIRSSRIGHVRCFAMVVLVSTLLLQGCAAVNLVIGIPVVLGGAAIAVDPDLEPIPKAETNRVTLGYPVLSAYAALTQTVERDGRRIVEATPATYTLRVSYPFSLFANNWGGVITITCVPEGPDTTITILGSGRDANHRVKNIGHEIIYDLRIFLMQQPEGPEKLHL